MKPPPIPRRDFLRLAIATSGAAIGCAGEPPEPPPAGPAALPPNPTRAAPPVAPEAPAIVTPEAARPVISYGVQSGDVGDRSAIVWSRCDRRAKMIVEWSPDASFGTTSRVEGPVATAETDFTARVDLGELPAGTRVHYRVTFEDADTGRAKSEPAAGSFRTPPAQRADVTLVWSGDTCGQGWGINREWGGIRMYETMRRVEPDLFIHSGDMIYADSPILPEVTLVDGSIWRNLTTAAKSKVAETLDEFRGNFAYNLLDENVRRFNAEVPMLAQWDDHETHNNWYPGQILDDPRYAVERACSVLSERGRQAMFEYTPIRRAPGDPRRVYRSFRYGPSLDVFMLDERTYRGPNSDNRQEKPSEITAFLGRAQLDWLKAGLAASKATWKLVASDMPLGLVVGDGRKGGVQQFEAWANGKGPPLGREHELAELLSFIKRRNVKNVVFVTADVHYAAAHQYDPKAAKFTDFKPFWEFVAGPIHASTYGPDALDNTFGPRVVYQSPPSGRRRRAPADGAQYFGLMHIDGRTEALSVSLHDLAGTKLFGVELPPER